MEESRYDHEPQQCIFQEPIIITECCLCSSDIMDDCHACPSYIFDDCNPNFYYKCSYCRNNINETPYIYVIRHNNKDYTICKRCHNVSIRTYCCNYYDDKSDRILFKMTNRNLYVCNERRNHGINVSDRILFLIAYRNHYICDVCEDLDDHDAFNDNSCSTSCYTIDCETHRYGHNNIGYCMQIMFAPLVLYITTYLLSKNKIINLLGERVAVFLLYKNVSR
jgi:hypothetical protein